MPGSSHINRANQLYITTHWYDLLYRNYDPVVGRFWQVDPVAGKYASLIPYNYSFNNSVTFNGTNYQVLVQVHTHPDAQPFGRYEVAGDLVTQSFLGVPVYIIRTNGFYNINGTFLGSQQEFFNGTKSLIGGKNVFLSDGLLSDSFHMPGKQ
jgi:RHS repeat-associated protein